MDRWGAKLCAAPGIDRGVAATGEWTSACAMEVPRRVAGAGPAVRYEARERKSGLSRHAAVKRIGRAATCRLRRGLCVPPSCSPRSSGCTSTRASARCRRRPHGVAPAASRGHRGAPLPGGAAAAGPLACAEPCATGATAPLGRTRGRPGHWTWSVGTSPPGTRPAATARLLVHRDLVRDDVHRVRPRRLLPRIVGRRTPVRHAHRPAARRHRDGPCPLATACRSPSMDGRAPCRPVPRSPARS